MPGKWFCCHPALAAEFVRVVRKIGHCFFAVHSGVGALVGVRAKTVGSLEPGIKKRKIKNRAYWIFDTMLSRWLAYPSPFVPGMRHDATTDDAVCDRRYYQYFRTSTYILFIVQLLGVESLRGGK